jgi:hypothetical protein
MFMSKSPFEGDLFKHTIRLIFFGGVRIALRQFPRTKRAAAASSEREAFLEENEPFADVVEGRMSARGAQCAGAVRRSLQALKESVFAKIRGQSL